jgi:hypothetical protein
MENHDINPTEQCDPLGRDEPAEAGSYTPVCAWPEDRRMSPSEQATALEVLRQLQRLGRAGYEKEDTNEPNTDAQQLGRGDA